MKQAATVKVISECRADIEQVAHALEAYFTVIATSGVIFDFKTGKYHRFFNVMRKGELQ